jgi:hypothetical protein
VVVADPLAGVVIVVDIKEVGKHCTTTNGVRP